MTCNDFYFINTTQKTSKPFKKKKEEKKCVSIPRMDEKNFHTQEFQLKGIGRNMRCKLLQKRSTGKAAVFQTLVIYLH